MTTFIERAVTFGRSGSLSGVLCTPPGTGAASSGRPIGIFLTSGILHRVGPNRIYVRLARALAARGVRSLRFDLSGIGESPALRHEDGPVEEIVHRDIADAIQFAIDRGASKVVLLGLCSGADHALQAAARHEAVVGAVLLDPDVHCTPRFHWHRGLRALLNAQSWRLLVTGRHPTLARLLAWPGGTRDRDGGDSLFLAPTRLPARQVMVTRLGAILSRGCKLFFVFTGGLVYRYNHRDQIFGAYPVLRGDAHVELAYHADAGHTFNEPLHQERLIDAILGWFDRLPDCQLPTHSEDAVSPAPDWSEPEQTTAVATSEPPHIGLMDSASWRPLFDGSAPVTATYTRDLELLRKALIEVLGCDAVPRAGSVNESPGDGCQPGEPVLPAQRERWTAMLEQCDAELRRVRERHHDAAPIGGVR